MREEEDAALAFFCSQDFVDSVHLRWLITALFCSLRSRAALLQSTRAALTNSGFLVPSSTQASTNNNNSPTAARPKNTSTPTTLPAPHNHNTATTNRTADTALHRLEWVAHLWATHRITGVHPVLGSVDRHHRLDMGEGG